MCQGTNSGGLSGNNVTRNGGYGDLQDDINTTMIIFFITLQGSLYDMTHFTGHPGGVGRLQMAAGNDLEV